MKSTYEELAAQMEYDFFNKFNVHNMHQWQDHLDKLYQEHGWTREEFEEEVCKRVK